MSAWIALLRGINVGGAHRVPMGELRDLFAELGYPNAQTFIQSGNVVVPGPLANNAEPLLEAAFQTRFGFASTFFVRSLNELETTIAGNPFITEAAENPSRLLVHFFKFPVPCGAEAARVGQERVQIGPLQAYVFYPSGIVESKIQLPGLSTARNWNTVLKLRELASCL